MKGNGGSLLWEDCILAGMNDDAFNISTHCSRVRRKLSPTTLEVVQTYPLDPMPWHEGGTLSAADFASRTLFGTARIVRVTGWTTGRRVEGQPAASPVTIEIDRPIPGLDAGAMLAKVYHGACWDSRRKQIVYTVPGLMAAYDPQARKWQDLKPRTAFGGWDSPAVLPDHFYEGPALVLAGDLQPGPPPCYGQSTCYDPVNDEILLFPHFGAANLDVAKSTGSVSGHLGTLVYRFSDNAWQRVSDSFGADETKKARRAATALMATASKAADAAWALGRGQGAAKAEGVRQGFADAVAALEQMAVPDGCKPMLADAGKALRQAVDAAAAAKWGDAVAGGGRAVWVLELLLDKALRVEPPPRCGTPLVYDPRNQAIVMFGGHSGLVRHDLWAPGQGEGSPGRLNDTWLYDCKTKQWREASGPLRPPPTLWPKLVYDPASGLVLLVAWETKMWDANAPRTVTLWGLDAATAEWRQLDRQPWTGEMCRTRHGASLAEIALDERNGLLILAQQAEDGRGARQTYALKLDVSKMAAQAAPAWAEPEPLRPHAIPPDEPAAVAQLKALPANKWVHVRPPHDGVDKGWGNAACDPVRGHVYYFGGGHSTYQVNDVAVYAPGANRWVYAAGDHNDWIPPAYWDGTCMGLRGGPPAGHQRNYYCVVDGRMYVSTGAESRRWGAATAKAPGQRYSWFYDLDRGGVWRRQPVSVAKDDSVPGVYGRANMATPDGRIIGFGGGLEPYNGRFFPGEVYFSSLDPATNTLTVRKVASGPACCPGEDRPFCYMADRDQVFFYEFVGSREKAVRQGTWVYDVKRNAFTDLKPKAQPPASPRAAEYIDGQDAVFAVVGGGEQWVYSFKRNTWAPLPLEADAAMGFASPYAQVVYSAKYGVLVNVGSHSRGTAVMRPDFSQIKWE